MRLFWADLHSANAAEEWRGSWAIAALYRRPGILVAFAASRLGLSPLQITCLGLALALTLPLQAALLPLGVAAWAVALSGALFQVLDCADGALARTTGQSSTRGGDVDFLVDMAQWGLLYAAIGLLADRMLEPGLAWTALAVAAAWARLLARVIRDRLSAPSDAPPTPIKTKDLPVVIVSGLSGLLPFLALSGGALPWAVGFLMLYALLDVGDALAPLFTR